MKKVVVMLIACLVILLISFSIISYTNIRAEEYVENKTDQINKLLNDEEYSQALELMKNEESEIQDKLNSEAEKHILNLCEESLTNLSIDKLVKLKNAGWNYVIIDETISQIQTSLEELRISSESYLSAQQYYEARDFENAYTFFSAVIKNDKDNYANAQVYLSELNTRNESWDNNIVGRNYYYNSVCFDGEFLYIPFILDGVDGICKTNIKGDAVGFFPLSEEAGKLVIKGLNVVGEYLYFIAGENVGSGYTFDHPYCIYEMKTDGTNIAVVSEGNFTDLFIKGDSAYAISRDYGLIEYDRNFKQQQIICEDYVVDFSFNDEGIYYTVQQNLTYNNDDIVYFFNGTETTEIDRNEYLHYFRFGDEYIKCWQNNTVFEMLHYGNASVDVQIRNADIYEIYGMLNGKILYSCNGSLGREILYAYQINNMYTEQLVENKEIMDYKIIGIFYEGNKLIIEKGNNLYFSDIAAADLTQITLAAISDENLKTNSEVIMHLSENDLYRESSDGEIISVIQDKQIWFYNNDKLNIVIEKRYADEYDCNIYVTHIFTNDYSLFTTGNANPNSLSASKAYKASDISNTYGMIFAQSTDTFMFSGNEKEGVIIRRGTLVRDIFLEDMIAYYDDGTMEVYKAGDGINGQTLIENGVTTSFSFGPILVDDYAVDTDCVTVRLADRNPRSAIGYVEPGHYVLVAADGRDYAVSRGLTMLQLARIFEDEGCKLAYNLDGGMTTSVLFMGHYVTHRPSYSSGSQWFFYRSVAELLYFGTSDLSPTDLSQFTYDYDFFADNIK